jgi:hypothetical protein
MRIPDPESVRPWIRDGKIRIRDKLPGSATLVVRVAKLQKQTRWHTRDFYLSFSRFLSFNSYVEFLTKYVVPLWSSAKLSLGDKKTITRAYHLRGIEIKMVN